MKMNGLRKIIFVLAVSLGLAPLAFAGKSNTEMDNKDLRKQTVQTLQNDLTIDEAYHEAKTIPALEPAKLATEQVVIPEELTDQEIVASLLSDELKKTKIDLDFDEVKLGDIFMTVGKAGNINVMVAPQFKATTMDLHLKQVTIDEAFVLIANAFNLGFKKVNGSLFVTSKSEIKSENSISKVIKLRNIKAQDAKTMVEDLVQSVDFSVELNSLIVQGEPAQIERVNKVIQSIDKPQPQIILEAKIIEMNKDALKDVGVDWSDSMSFSFQEINRNAKLTDPTSYTDAVTVNPIQRSAMQFNATIQMLENQNKAKVLSSPRIATMNDKEAEIFVGDRIPYTITSVTGGTASTEVRFEEPGIRLKITPSIIDNEFVVIRVEPEVSYIFSWTGDNSQYPWIKKRSAIANIRVKDQQPFIMGGLLNQEDKKNLYKVPMLGSLPLLGNIFSHEKNTVLDTELIITITPFIVRSDM